MSVRRCLRSRLPLHTTHQKQNNGKQAALLTRTTHAPYCRACCWLQIASQNEGKICPLTDAQKRALEIRGDINDPEKLKAELGEEKYKALIEDEDALENFKGTSIKKLMDEHGTAVAGGPAGGLVGERADGMRVCEREGLVWCAFETRENGRASE